ncbi:MAG: endo-1,4-beta-xylanase, partial [Promicromonosporaceae bacterium]|nr:endo-1,4-beta-xylanase [Promicromonosporaceae bacterium]
MRDTIGAMPGLFSAPRSDYPLDPKYGARRGETLVTVVDAGGNPIANAEVEVAQTNHQFLFGNIGFELIDWINGYRHDDDGGGVAPLQHLEIGETPLGRDTSGSGGELSQREYDEVLAQRWLALFNQATLPFYWGRFEPVEGQPRTAELKRAAEWFRDRNVVLKGHPLVWHTVQPDWLLEKPLSEVEHLLRRRIRREVTDFAGLIDTWDAINEVVIMPVFDNGDNAITPLSRVLGRIGMVRRAFEDARKANPHVTLILNDFDMSTAYEALLEGVLEAGIKIDKLGLQSHQQQGFWGLEKTERVLNRFARYNIPIHFTETTLVSGDLMPPEIVDLNDYQVTEWPTTPEGEERQA